jgi:hypothetical protein
MQAILMPSPSRSDRVSFLDHGNIEPGLARRHGTGQARRSCANDDDVGVWRHVCSLWRAWLRLTEAL